MLSPCQENKLFIDLLPAWDFVSLLLVGNVLIFAWAIIDIHGWNTQYNSGLFWTCQNRDFQYVLQSHRSTSLGGYFWIAIMMTTLVVLLLECTQGYCTGGNIGTFSTDLAISGSSVCCLYKRG